MMQLSFFADFAYKRKHDRAAFFSPERSIDKIIQLIIIIYCMIVHSNEGGRRRCVP